MQRRSESGQTLTLVAFAMVAFLAAAGLAVDMGYMRYEKRLMQSAADSAALAAAIDANLGEAGMATTDAQAVATANGFQDGVNNVTVSVTNPDGAVNPSNAVQVSIQQVLPSIFMQVVGINTSTVSASGVATIGTSEGCIYALQVGGAGLTFNAGINGPNCGIVDNGPLTGAGNITAVSVGVYGGFGGYGGFSGPGAVQNIVQPAADPLAYLTPPGAGGCTTTELVNATSGPAMNGIITLDPGIYCSITITDGGVATFNPGLYIINGPTTGLLITGTGIATGNGVTLYNTGGGAITFNGTGIVTLSAPNGGVGNLPPGILFYQDPSDNAAADVSEAASGNVKLSGTLYFPNAALTIAGSVGGTNALIVANSVTVAGSVPLDSDLTSVPGGSPLQSVSLVE
jgi:Flp pilus assembly protein TadG